jgi:hypothetical protein
VTGPRAGIPTFTIHFFCRLGCDAAIGSYTPFAVSSRSGECFGRINAPDFLSSPLAVVGKGFELTRNRPIGHGLGNAKCRLCSFQVFPASL